MTDQILPPLIIPPNTPGTPVYGPVGPEGPQGPSGVKTMVRKRHPDLDAAQQNTLAQKALSIYSESKYSKLYIGSHLLVKIAYARSLIPPRS